MALRTIALLTVPLLATATSCGGIAHLEGGGGQTAAGGAAGVGIAGNASGSTGSSGPGGSSSEPCSLPADPGSCGEASIAWWYNPATGICEPFTYGGCGGNDNRFSSSAICSRICGGVTIDGCVSPADCVITTPGCCAPCDANETQLIAINRKFAGTFGNCSGIACGGCAPVDPFFAARPYFAATCVEHWCYLMDLRQTEYTACTEDTDCRLRAGTECCEDCATDQIVALAINKSSSFQQLTCGDQPPACRHCAPQIPADYGARCVDQRCRTLLVKTQP
jgi:Kunitz/Bovine pancreatic trypsin inhibitor domain